jgi:sugar lactone lactonase YvrE
MFKHSFDRRRLLAALLLLVLSLPMIAATDTFPDVIPLPNGFAPEGIASGKGTTFYVGSIPTGAIYRGDFRTGTGEILVQPQEGRSAIGMKYDPRTDLLFVAGGATGEAFIYNGTTGANVADVQFTTDPSFINDVVITQDAAYFTNSFAPVLYKIPLEPSGALPDPLTFEVIPLSGDYQFVAGGFNANGIDATPNGKVLIIVNSTTGKLYSVDPSTGVATEIDLGGGSVPTGDGILLQGKTLYVAQNSLNQITVIKLNSDYTSGEIVDTITDVITNLSSPAPTTIAAFGNSLYVVNARFGVPVTPDTQYEIVRVPRH